MLLASLLAGLAVLLLGLWIGPLWDAIARRQVADLAPRMEELNLDVSRLPLYLRCWGAALAGAIVLVGFVLQMPLFAPVAVYLIYIAPRLALILLLERRQRQLRDQMVGASVTLANATRAGLSLAQGLESLSKETPEPLATEFRKLVRDYYRGRPLADAIRDVKSRVNLDGFTLFANAILTCLERGGKVTEALERISKSLQENQRLERKLEADTAAGRKVVLILGLFPIVCLIGFFLMDPEATGLLFSTIAGQLILVVITGMVYGSVRWARHILNLGI
jgi:tight adherence protein B